LAWEPQFSDLPPDENGTTHRRVPMPVFRKVEGRHLMFNTYSLFRMFCLVDADFCTGDAPPPPPPSPHHPHPPYPAPTTPHPPPHPPT
jgi:hypothetical protein